MGIAKWMTFGIIIVMALAFSPHRHKCNSRGEQRRAPKTTSHCSIVLDLVLVLDRLDDKVEMEIVIIG